jgi:hypothetical protein
MQKRKLAQICAVAILAASLSGCAAPIIAGITLSQITTVAGLISTAFTGKGLTDQALSIVTGKDCNLMESVLRKDRHLCEERGSLATADDFKGIFVAFGGKDADPLQRYARARQLEVADATTQTQPPTEPVAVETASAVNLPAIRIGIPERGAPTGLARVDGDVVYIMAPIYDGADTAQGPVPAPQPRPTQVADLRQAMAN